MKKLAKCGPEKWEFADMGGRHCPVHRETFYKGTYCPQTRFTVVVPASPRFRP